jgi:hypothetical protein
MIAICYIRPDPVYRREAFVSGLAKAGYRLAERGRPSSRDDLLVIWNRYGRFESLADDWELDGGSVLVAENGYIGKDELGRQYYALAIHGHNGSGWWPVDDADRFSLLGISVLPWANRTEGYSLICGQRGIGSRTMASPPNWHFETQRAMEKHCAVKVRLHPGNKPAATKLDDDLENAKECVIWSSASGVKSLVMGVPVRYAAPHWVCESAAVPLVPGDATAKPVQNDADRARALHRMSYAQWSVAEIESGEPFNRMRDRISEASW